MIRGYRCHNQECLRWVSMHERIQNPEPVALQLCSTCKED